MSFYGSVYYQLVDTFYKVVAKNTGKDNLTFIVPNKEAELPNQAVGRKGVIELDSGNRWINFSDAGAEDSAAYKIWHGKPDTETVTPDHGFKLLNVSDADMTDRTKDGVIQLIAADEFETYETQYDKAGHIAETIRKVYRLPKSETDERLDELERLVGTDADKVMPDVEEKNLYGFVEENSADIKTLETYVGKWPEYTLQSQNFPISRVIGKIGVLLGENFLHDGNFKSIVDVLGTIKDFEDTDLYRGDEKPLSITDGLTKLKKAIDSLNGTVNDNKTTSDFQYSSIGSVIGEKINDDSIYDHIKAIYGVNDGVVTDSLTSLALRAKALEDKDKSLDQDIKDIRDAMNWSDERTISKAIDDIEKTLNWTSENTVAKEISEIQKDLGWTRENSVLVDITSLEGRATNLETHATNSEKDIDDLQDRAKAIEEAAQLLTQRVDDHYNNQNDENSKLHEADSKLDERITNLVNAVGLVPESKTVISLIEEANTDFEAAIGNLPEDSNVIKEIESAETRLQDQIDSISESLGAVPDGKNAYSLIDKNITDIQTINNKIGSINAENPISELISENTRLIAGIQTDYVTKEAAKAYLTTEAAAKTYLTSETAEATYAPLGIIGDTSSWENPDNTIVAKINSLEGKIDSVEKIVGNEELEEGQTIIGLLLELKTEIDTIKNTIAELHPTDPPTPDEEEPVLPPKNGEEEEEPIE